MFQFNAVTANFFEACSNYDTTLDPLLTSLLNNGWHMLRRNDKLGHIDLVGDIQETGVGFYTLDGSRFGVHGVQDALIPGVEQIPEDIEP